MLNRCLILAILLSLAACGGRRPDMVPIPTPAPSQSPIPMPSFAPLPVLPPKPIEEVYAPVLHLDSREKSPITSIDRFLAMGVALKADRKGETNPVIQHPVSPEDLAKYPQSEMMRWGKPYQLYLEAHKQISALDNVTYFNKVEIGGFTYLQYWFFYAFNDTSLLGGPPGGTVEACGNHQGDWEHVSLRIHTASFQAAATVAQQVQAIDDIYFSQHTRYQHFDRKWFRPDQPPISFEGSHLKVFVANGSHASYPAPSPGKGYLLMKLLGFAVYDIADGQGSTVRTAEGQLVPLREQSWLAFGGKWGGISHGACNLIEFFSPASNDGPFGPSKGDNAPYFHLSDWHGVQRPPHIPAR